MIDYAALSVIFALITALGLVGGWVFKLSGRLAMADAKADAAAKDANTAAITTQALRVAIEQNERDLVEHRVHVAKEYVSNQTIAGLEEKLIRAIDRLGDRLDAIFADRAKGI